MQGTVFSIEEFSVYDGPGIRTTVFLKGCPLRCTWCHNPEGQEPQPQIVRSPNGCIGCGSCIKNAMRKNGKLHFSEASIAKCPMHLLRVCGERLESNDLCTKLLKNKIILSRGGGITFSGGEPLTQSEFLFECLAHLKGQLHTAIQTCGFASSQIFQKALSLTDYVLYDLKLADDGMHRRYTGVSNQQILQNFSTLVQSGVPFTVRLPLIPQVTDTPENVSAIAALLHDSSVGYIELLPYNKMAGGKYQMLLRDYTPQFDEQQEVALRTEIFERFGITTKVL